MSISWLVAEVCYSVLHCWADGPLCCASGPCKPKQMLSLDLWGSSFLQELNEIASFCRSSAPSHGKPQGGASLVLHTCCGTVAGLRPLGQPPYPLGGLISLPVVSIAFLSCWGEMKVCPIPRRL